MNDAAPESPVLTVLYDGACPLCRREIGLYRGLRASTPLCFADVSDAAVRLPPGTSREQLLARFHVRNADGRLLSGAPAFLALWAALPGWRWLARAGRLPGATWTLERVYRLFLHGRPTLQRWASRWGGADGMTGAPGADGASNAPATAMRNVGPNPIDLQPLPASLVADLRTDHAGEAGAVMIYRGILAIARDAQVRQFAHHHLATETSHLARIEPLLSRRQRSALLPLWRMAGWLTGALPALAGPRAVYATIEAVETFVDRHYAEQIEAIDQHDAAGTTPSLQAVRTLLQGCRSDEVAHRDEAAALLAQAGRPSSVALRVCLRVCLPIWVRMVGSGSRVAVGICRRV